MASKNSAPQDRAMTTRSSGPSISPTLLLLGLGGVALALKGNIIPSSNPPSATNLSMTASMTTPQVNVGSYAKASLTITNKGSSSASVSITGKTTYKGAVVGQWVPASVTVGAGKTATVPMQSAGTIVAQYIGDTLTATFEAA